MGPIKIQNGGNYAHVQDSKCLPYRTKLRRTKVTNFFGGNENFVQFFFFKCHNK